MSEVSGAIRYFSGENEDGREYKRWKTWAQNKLLTMDKLPETSRGAFIYTLLSGKALEAVEHLKAEEYQKKDGDLVLWALLDQRFPQLETVDELGEILNEVFSLKAKEGESMKQWTARSGELFDRCARKTGVVFPEEARGWLMLHRACLSEEQKAVVIARARGELKKDSVGSALRSCYPEWTVPKKKAVALVTEEALLVDPDDELALTALEEEFSDVNQLLDDHQLNDETSEAFQETDVAEVLAASWKDKRRELNKLQKSRQFGKARDLRKSFRVEIEELKKQTLCHKCHRPGHWARECRSKSDSKPSASTGQSSHASGAALAQAEPDFVAFVSTVPTLTHLVRSRVQEKQAKPSPSPSVAEPDKGEAEVLLVSSPGYGVLDSGCGRTIIGSETLREFEKLWSQKGALPSRIQEMHQFRFGNGEVETSTQCVSMPVLLANRRGTIKASVVKGFAPLLISRSAMKALGASLN